MNFDNLIEGQEAELKSLRVELSSTDNKREVHTIDFEMMLAERKISELKQEKANRVCCSLN